MGIVQTGPALATGGAFGPDAGRVGIGAALAGIAILWGWPPVRLRPGPPASH